MCSVQSSVYSSVVGSTVTEPRKPAPARLRWRPANAQEAAFPPQGCWALDAATPMTENCAHSGLGRSIKLEPGHVEMQQEIERLRIEIEQLRGARERLV